MCATCAVLIAGMITNSNHPRISGHSGADDMRVVVFCNTCNLLRCQGGHHWVSVSVLVGT